MGENELGHRSCSEHVPLNFGPEGAGDGRFYRTASGEWIPDGGAWQFQGYDENGLLRSLEDSQGSRKKKKHNIDTTRKLKLGTPENPRWKRCSLNKTYKCHTEANDKVWDLNRKTERALRRCRCYTRGSIRLTANLQR